jgi:SMC interacting uncharacterized protein involved in chromosome segregation
MVMNQLEFTLQEITNTLAQLEKNNCKDEELLNSLKAERDQILEKLHVNI